MTVKIEKSCETPIPLAEFVVGVLAGDLFWAETRPGGFDVELQIASISCWKCHSPIKAIRGYIVNDQLITLAEISDTDAVTTFIEKLGSQDPRVTPVSRRYSKTREGQYFAASCPSCRALIGVWFMTADFFTDTVDCNYPDCSCPEARVYGPELGCYVFEYHPIALNIGSLEIADLPAGEWKWRPFTRGAIPVRNDSKIG